VRYSNWTSDSRAWDAPAGHINPKARLEVCVSWEKASEMTSNMLAMERFKEMLEQICRKRCLSSQKDPAESGTTERAGKTEQPESLEDGPAGKKSRADRAKADKGDALAQRQDKRACVATLVRVSARRPRGAGRAGAPVRPARAPGRAAYYGMVAYDLWCAVRR
jgi:hypothetical protein